MEDETFRTILECFPPPPAISSNTTTAGSDDNDGAVDVNSSAAEDDRISHLSEDLLRKIVSGLPAKDGARTMAISPPWRGIWTSVPLVLDDAQFLPPAGGGDKESDAVVGSAVSGALASHPGPFTTVRLTSSSLHNNEAALRDWVRAMVTKGVGDLVIFNRHWPAALALPEEILRCTSVERLHIALCHLPEILDRQADIVDFPNLRELVMCNSFLPSDDLAPLLAGSPKLELLSLINNYGAPRYMDVTSSSLKCLVLWLFHPSELTLKDTPCLERLVLWGTTQFCFPPPSRVKITTAPGLREIGYLNPRLHVVQIGETVIKAGTEARPALMIPSVETLGLKIMFGFEDDERILLSFLKLFPNVKNLYMMSTLPVFCPISDGLEFWMEKLSSVECVRSKLRRFTFIDFNGETDCELEFIQAIAGTASFLEEMRIALSYFVDAPDETKDALAESLSAASWASNAANWEIFQAECGEFDYKTASDMSRDPFDFIVAEGAFDY